MSFQIRIEPDALRTAAERQRSIQKATEEIQGGLATQIRQLDQAWDGGASIQAIKNLDAIKNKVDDLLQGVYMGANFLDGVANAFEALDDNPEVPNNFFAPFVRFEASQFVLGCPRPDFSLVINGRLRIIPESVRDVGKQCKAIAQRCAEEGDSLNATLKSLEDNWEGKAFQKFAADTEDLVTAYKKLTSILDEFGDKVTHIANRYEDLDRRF